MIEVTSVYLYFLLKVLDLFDTVTLKVSRITVTLRV